MTRSNEPRLLAAVLLVVLTALPTLARGAQRQDSQGTVPELAGAERVTGSLLVDGHLPAPWLDYIIDLGGDRSQKLTIYQNGLVTLGTRFGDRSSLKKVLFPPGAIAIYKEHLDGKLLESIDEQPLIVTPTKLRELIRIYDDEGRHVERKFDPSLYLPSNLEGARALLQDLSRVIIEDNELTNPMVDYVPQRDDRLLDEQMDAWVILQVVNDHLEVQKENSPLRVWLKIEQLDEQFINWSRPAATHE